MSLFSYLFREKREGIVAPKEKRKEGRLEINVLPVEGEEDAPQRKNRGLRFWGPSLPRGRKKGGDAMGPQTPSSLPSSQRKEEPRRHSRGERQKKS